MATILPSAVLPPFQRDGLSILAFILPHIDPIVFDVPLVDGWFSFDKLEDYQFCTDNRCVEMTLFDAEEEEFVPMFQGGGLKVNSTLHPWVIVRVRTLQDRECKNLARRIRRLMDARAGAQQLLAGYRSLYTNRVKPGARGTTSMAPNAAGSSRHAGITEVTEAEKSGGGGGGISRNASAMIIDVDNFSSGSDYVDEDESSDSTEDDSDGMELDEMELDELQEEDELESAAEAATVVDHLTCGMTDMTGDD